MIGNKRVLHVIIKNAYLIISDKTMKHTFSIISASLSFVSRFCEKTQLCTKSTLKHDNLELVYKAALMPVCISVN